MLDLHWLRPGPLKKWITELKKYSIFENLNDKNYSRPKGRLYDLKLLRWLEYNQNDLISTYYLCLYEHNLFMCFKNAYTQTQISKEPTLLSSNLLNRKKLFLKD